MDGNLTSVDCPQDVGLDDCSSLVFQDVNKDRLPDIYMVRFRKENKLLINKGGYRRLQDVTESTALVSMGMASDYDHRFDRALDYAREAIAVAREIGAQRVLADAHSVCGHVYAVTGRLDKARVEINRVLENSEWAKDEIHQPFTLFLVGLTKNWQGDYGEAASILSKSLRIARDYNLVGRRFRSLFGYGLALIGKGDYDQAIIYSILNEDIDQLDFVDPQLYQVIIKCLCKNPEERFQSSAELINELNYLREDTAAINDKSNVCLKIKGVNSLISSVFDLEEVTKRFWEIAWGICQTIPANVTATLYKPTCNGLRK